MGRLPSAIGPSLLSLVVSLLPLSLTYPLLVRIRLTLNGPHFERVVSTHHAGVESVSGVPVRVFGGLKSFPEIVDGDASKDKGGVAMIWEKRRGVSDGKTNVIAGIVRRSWLSKGHWALVDDVKKRANWAELSGVLTSVCWGRRGREEDVAHA